MLILQPITGALVYLGTTIKDLSDITHDWGHFTTFEWVKVIKIFIYLKLNQHMCTLFFI